MDSTCNLKTETLGTAVNTVQTKSCPLTLDVLSSDAADQKKPTTLILLQLNKVQDYFLAIF